MTNLGGLCLELLSGKGLESAFLEGIGLKHGMVQERPFSGNTWVSAARTLIGPALGAGLRESLAAVGDVRK